MAKKIEDKYKSLSDIDHILLRSGMWVGSTKSEEKDMFLWDSDEKKFRNGTVEYIPAMLKIVDEVISNSVDEYRRKDNMGLDRIDVCISPDTGIITVKDNGGIPVVMHKEAGCYVPEFIFGRLRTSSNYNDDEDRSGVGTNGVGVKIANIFSTKFTIDTCDGKKLFHRSWCDNMKTLCDDLAVTKCTDHYTRTSFHLDFGKLDTKDTTFTPDFIEVIRKRCIDAAAANPGLTVSFNDGTDDSEWRFDDFRAYIGLYDNLLANTENGLHYTNDIADIYIYPDSNIDVAFVNGAECSKGTHLRAIRNDINGAVVDFLTKKDKMDITTRSVDGKYAVFMNITVSNPSYDSQTKDTLTTTVERFTKDGYEWKTSDKFIAQILKSEIIELMRDWYRQKVAADDQKTLRRLNADAKKGLKRPDKYVPANTKIKSNRELWIYEGDSAATGFRVARNPQTQGAYLMRGVPLNSLGMTPVQIMKNEVYNDIISILGLQFGRDFSIDNLNYGRIVIATDGDTDGDKIASLLLLFFSTNWPELIDRHIVCRSMSPIIIATKGADKKVYYKLDDYRKEQTQLKGYQIIYTKGLGGLNPKFYKDMMSNPKYLYFKRDKTSEIMFKKWFGSESEERKKLMVDVIR